MPHALMGDQQQAETSSSRYPGGDGFFNDATRELLFGSSRTRCRRSSLLFQKPIDPCRVVMVRWEQAWRSSFSWLGNWMAEHSPLAQKPLGTIWTGEQTIQAWCDKNDLRSNRDGERVRIELCNLSTEEDLVYSWINHRGEVRHFGVLERLTKSQKGDQDEYDDEPGDSALLPVDETADQRRKHIERSFVGHAFVFGRLKKKDDDVKNLKDLGDIVVLGAYRPECASRKIKEPRFPTHILKLQPPQSTRNRIGIFCCPPSQMSREDNTVRSFLRKRKHKEEANFEYDPSWTLHVSEASMEEELADLLDTTKTKEYQETTICDWPVYMDTSESSKEKEHVKTFQKDLKYALNHLPPTARKQLLDRRCAIWVNKSFRYGPQESPEVCRHLCFHPDGAWLNENKMHPEKAKCVELYDLQHYCESDRDNWGPGGVLIHELSHAYHNICLPNSYDNEEIIACYQQAMKEGLYENVAVHGPAGPTAKAYACENAMEYFAELSTAFLGGLDEKEEYNKWYPFNRKQLEQHDPRAYALLQKLWNVKDQ